MKHTLSNDEPADHKLFTFNLTCKVALCARPGPHPLRNIVHIQCPLQAPIVLCPAWLSQALPWKMDSLAKEAREAGHKTQSAGSGGKSGRGGEADEARAGSIRY